MFAAGCSPRAGSGCGMAKKKRLTAAEVFNLFATLDEDAQDEFYCLLIKSPTYLGRWLRHERKAEERRARKKGNLARDQIILSLSRTTNDSDAAIGRNEKVKALNGGKP